MILLGSAAGELVADLIDAIDHAGRCLADKGALPAQLGDQVPGDVAELSREVLMDVENMHGIDSLIHRCIDSLKKTKDRLWQ